MENFNFDFDLEKARNELEHINDLLGIYSEFVDTECPQNGVRGKDAQFSALIFADRAHMFQSLIRAAQDKIIEMHGAMESAITKYFADAKKKADKKGGEAA